VKNGFSRGAEDRRLHGHGTTLAEGGLSLVAVGGVWASILPIRYAIPVAVMTPGTVVVAVVSAIPVMVVIHHATGQQAE